MSQQVAGAEVGAITALVAGGAPPLDPRPQRATEVANHSVVFGQHDQAGGGLGDRLGEALGQPTHHRPAHHHRVVLLSPRRPTGDLDPASPDDGLTDGGANGQIQGLGLVDRAGDGQQAVGDGNPLLRPGDVEQRAHVLDDAAHVKRQPRLRNQPPRDLVDQDELVASGVVAFHQIQGDVPPLFPPQSWGG